MQIELPKHGSLLHNILELLLGHFGPLQLLFGGLLLYLLQLQLEVLACYVLLVFSL